MINTRKDNAYWDPSRKGFVTNYPNFLHWKTLSATDMADNRPLNVYLHTPYCIQHCAYCYYKTINLRGTNKAQRIDQYVDALCREIELASEYYQLRNRPVVSVYFGGGTPSLLNEAQLQRVLETVHRYLNLSDQTELTVEAEPVTITQSKADLLQGLGVNRVSMGVQSFDDGIIKRSNRLDDEKKVMKAIEIVKTMGVVINIDLMSGLAEETQATWEYSVRRAIESGVESITVYKTELYTNTPYYKEVRNKTIDLPDDDQELIFMNHAMTELTEAGYKPWSFFTFTQCGQHQHQYATGTFLGEDVYSFGTSAFGKLGDYLFQNTNDEQKYMALLAEGELPVTRGHRLTCIDAMIREIVLGMKLVRFDLRRFQSRYGFRLEKLCADTLADLVEHGFITMSDDEIQLTNKGILYGDYTGKSVAKVLMDME
ncbi:MAG: radical SAM family heme chaperone HemW [Chloroflexaceae bacterium]|nr:radical SAM family heme chaperone HemW [Chloroflexaceae bacterium]